MPIAGVSVARLVDWIARRHRAVIVAAAALTALSALSLLRLRFDMDVLSQLPSSSAVFTDYRAFLRGFGAFDSLIVLVRGPRAEIVPFATALAEKLARLPEIGSVRYRVDVDAVRTQFLEPYRAALLDDEGIAELARRLQPAAIDERVRGLKRALAAPMSIGARTWIAGDPIGIDEIVGRSLARRYADPLLRPSGEFFLSNDGSALVLVVRPLGSAFDTIFSERMLTRVADAERELLDGPWRDRGIDVGHTGSYVYAVGDKRVMRNDLRIYFVAAPLAVLAIFHLGLRTLRVLPFVIVPLAATTIVTFAVSLLSYGSLTMISVAFAGMFYGLGIDSSIYFYHLLSEKAAARRPLEPDGIRAAVRETLEEIGGANVVASTTTAVAFLVIGFSDFTGVSQLGAMTALAMLLNVVATFVLLPALVFAWGPRAIPEARARDRVADRCARFAVGIARRRFVVGIAAVALVVAVGAAGVPRVRLDTDFRHLRPSGGDAERVEQALAEGFGRLEAPGVLIVQRRDGEAALEAAERVAAALETERSGGLVKAYSSLTTFFPSAKTAAARIERFRALPRAEAARALERALDREGFAVGAFRAAIDSLTKDEWRAPSLAGDRTGPLAALVEQHWHQHENGLAIATYVTPAAGVSLAALESRMHRELPGVSFSLTGRPLVEDEFAALLRRELVWFLAGSLALNFALVLVSERSMVRALALLSPTLASLVVYLGILGIAGVPIDPINLIVLPLLIGLGVDDGVYLAAHARATGGLEPGVRRGALPLVLAVATTVAGFGSLGFSRYPALGRLGSLAALGLSLCVFAALVAIPLLVPWLVGEARSTNRHETPSQ
jgi:predicted exporter